MFSIQRRNFNRWLCVWVFSILLLAGACSRQTASPIAEPGDPSSTSQPQVSATPFPIATETPTATPEPLALRVNEEGISLAEYQASLQQLQSALETQGESLPEEEQRQQVLDSLVDTALLAQGALENGFSLDEAGLQAEIERLVGQLGGEAALLDWQTRNGYSEDSFRAALRRSMAAAWQRDRIADTVPTEAEQVRARQILVLDEASAQNVLQQVRVPGVNFANYAFRYDPLIGGDLGWFPRGYLTQPEVEEAAFALQPGQVSEIIESSIGYHIVQVVSREQRPLSPDARRTLQRAALRAWLTQRRAASTIEVILP